MPIRIESNAEPIPGYRLIERLGGGGFGEVWKAEAPGGLYKAIKFVYGDLHAADENEGFRAEQELKALSRVKTVHHPYILSLDRFDVVDGQLMIVMELADKTLWDRFRECRAQGLPGIPREELLSYLREAAEALDLMNNQFQLQHLDIKPQNLFLVFNHVKVADFGLVKDLGTRAAATITGGVTPVYAAPETFDGWLSRFSDQYSLAIVYQELLTGQRPFAGATMRQLILQHIQGMPDTSPLPAADRPAVERALAKDPEQRFPTCLEFIGLLDGAAAPPGMAAAEPCQARPEPRDVPADPPSALTRDVRAAGLGGPRPVDVDESDVSVGRDRPQVLPARPDSVPELQIEDAPSDADDDEHGHTCVSLRPRAGDPGARVPPALVIGLGRLGLGALQQLRRRLNADFHDAESLPHVRFLGVDVDQHAIHEVSSGDPRHSLAPTEVVLARLHRPTHYLKSRDGKAATDTWLNTRLIYRIPRDLSSAGCRPIGRLALVDNFRPIARRLGEELRACAAACGGDDEGEAAAPRSPRVYLITSLAGNTGGGMFVDVAYVVRNLLRRMGHGTAEVVGLFLVPPVPKEGAASTGLANAYAALTELHHYSRNYFQARYDTTDGAHATKSVRETTAPFQRCVVLEPPAGGKGTVDEIWQQASDSAAEYLYRQLATPVGQIAEESARQRQALADGREDGPAVQTFGSYRLTWPRHALLEKCGRKLSRRLVDHWLNKDARPLAEGIKQWAAERWDAIGMRPENLIARHQELCEKALRQAPDRLLAAVIAPLADVLGQRNTAAGAAEPRMNVGPVVEALAELDKLLGVPEECRPPSHSVPEPSVIERALTHASERVADESEQRLAELAVRLIEDPDFRLAGAEEALRQFSIVVERALQSQEPLAKELNDRAASLYQKIQQFLEKPVSERSPSSRSWGLTRGKKPGEAPPAAELYELLRAYPKARYHGLVLQQINRLYVSLRGYLSDQLREVGFCRQRLSELAGVLQPDAPGSGRKLSRRTQELLPAGCHALDDVIQKIGATLTHDDLIGFDRRVQELIKKQFGALVQVCMGASSVVRALAPAMVEQAEKFLEPKVQGASVAAMFLAQKETPEEVARDLEAFYEQAAPSPACPRAARSDEVTLAVVPGDPKGQELQEAVRATLPHARILATERGDEFVIFREKTGLTLADLDQLGPAAQNAYRQRLAADPSAVHTREDVAEWQCLALAAQ